LPQTAPAHVAVPRGITLTIEKGEQRDRVFPGGPGQVAEFGDRDRPALVNIF
jgi:hypothetical protein